MAPALSRCPCHRPSRLRAPTSRPCLPPRTAISGSAAIAARPATTTRSGERLSRPTEALRTRSSPSPSSPMAGSGALPRTGSGRSTARTGPWCARGWTASTRCAGARDGSLWVATQRRVASLLPGRLGRERHRRGLARRRRPRTLRRSARPDLGRHRPRPEPLPSRGRSRPAANLCPDAAGPRTRTCPRAAPSRSPSAARTNGSTPPASGCSTPTGWTGGTGRLSGGEQRLLH